MRRVSLELECAACGVEQQSSSRDAACRFCGERRLRRPLPKQTMAEKVAKATARRTVHGAEGQKLHAFLEGERWTARGLARWLSSTHGQGPTTPVNERSVRRWLTGGNTHNRDLAMRLAMLMVRRGYEPALIHPRVRRLRKLPTCRVRPKKS